MNATAATGDADKTTGQAAATGDADKTTGQAAATGGADKTTGQAAATGGADKGLVSVNFDPNYDPGKMRGDLQALAVVVGFALLIAGGFAIFHGYDSAGTAAMVTVGAIFSLIGINGRIIERFKFGDAELIAAKVREAQVTFLSGDKEQGYKMVQEIVEGTAPGTAALPAISERNKYNTEVISILRTGLPEGWSLLSEVPGPGYRFDAMTTGSRPEVKHIVVEIFYNPNFYGGELSRAISRARENHLPDIDAALIVVSSDRAPGVKLLEKYFKTQKLPGRVVQWVPGEPPDVLISNLNQLINDVLPNVSDTTDSGIQPAASA